MRLNLGYGSHPLDGFVNLDKKDGWYFQLGLDYEDGTVEAITVSHSLMFLKEIEVWNFIVEAYRVLEKGGVLRVTEDYSAYEHSGTFGGYKGSRIILGPMILKRLLGKAGFKVYFDNYWEYMSAYKDHSLIQRYHGKWPHVFHIEGEK